MHPLKNILNRVRWDKQEHPENYLITYRHRGAPDDVKRIRASSVMRLGKSYFTLQDAGSDDETVIPFHRILEVRNTSDDSVIWVSRKKEQQGREA